jgi:hypothetical protein
MIPRLLSGWSPDRIVRAWVTLMKRFAYTQFVAQGGDWGAVIVDMMGLHAPPELLAIHTNMPGVFPVEIDQAAFSGAVLPQNFADSWNQTVGQVAHAKFSVKILR